MARKEKTPELLMLETRGVFRGGFFRLEGDPPAYYAVTRGGMLLDLDGAEAALSENDIWEALSRITRISRDAFEEARRDRRDRVWRGQGKPDTAGMRRLAEAFAREYAENRDAGLWRAVCRYDEETIGRIAAEAAALLLGEDAPARTLKKKERELYRALVLAKVDGAALLGR